MCLFAGRVRGMQGWLTLRRFLSTVPLALLLRRRAWQLLLLLCPNHPAHALLLCLQVSSVELERVVMHHVPHILEAAAVGFPTPGGGPEQLHIFVVLARGAAGAGKHCVWCIGTSCGVVLAVWCVV